jgi:hypothetical protein
MSKREVSTDDIGNTSRGNLIFVTRLLFPVRLVVPNLRADTKNAHGNAFTPMPPMSAPVIGRPDTFEATIRTMTPALVMMIGISTAHSSPMTDCL